MPISTTFFISDFEKCPDSFSKFLPDCILDIDATLDNSPSNAFPVRYVEILRSFHHRKYTCWTENHGWTFVFLWSCFTFPAWIPIHRRRSLEFFDRIASVFEIFLAVDFFLPAENNEVRVKKNQFVSLVGFTNFAGSRAGVGFFICSFVRFERSDGGAATLFSLKIQNDFSSLFFCLSTGHHPAYFHVMFHHLTVYSIKSFENISIFFHTTRSIVVRWKITFNNRTMILKKDFSRWWRKSSRITSSNVTSTFNKINIEVFLFA